MLLFFSKQSKKMSLRELGFFDHEVFHINAYSFLFVFKSDYAASLWSHWFATQCRQRFL